ncbi:response regulator transcription factor [bacterium]|nr:response regulator transcription factor [bacterium]
MKDLSSIRLFIAVEHPLIRRGLAGFCAETPDVRVVGEAADGESALQAIAATKPDVVVVHAELPLGDGPELIAVLRDREPQLRSIILVPLRNRGLMRRAMASQADAFLLTTDIPQHVIRTVRDVTENQRFVCPLLAACSATVLNGEIPASVRAVLEEEQLALFKMIVEHKNGTKIARSMGIENGEVAQLRIALCERLHRNPLREEKGFAVPRDIPVIQSTSDYRTGD